MNRPFPLSQYLFIFSFSFILFYFIKYVRTYYQIRNGDSIEKHKRNIICTNN